MRNVRTCANSLDRLRPNLCLKETMVNTDKNQINLGHSPVTLGTLFRVTRVYLSR